MPVPSDFMLYLGAIALGALHAFEPGHGKTLIAAYMIGTKGRLLDGMLLGLIVTFTHTFSVILLGVIAKLLSHSYSDAQLHAWLGLGSATIILAVGIWMLKQRLSGSGGHHHVQLFSNDHGHHSHGGNGHSKTTRNNHNHSHSSDSHQDHCHMADHVPAGNMAERYNKWNLLLLGISGGLVPCPAAIATLLTAIAAGRVGQGLTMAIFFSLGLGLVMMTIGMVLSQAHRVTQKIGASQEFSKRMGILSALIIIALGAYTMFDSIQDVVAL